MDKLSLFAVDDEPYILDSIYDYFNTEYHITLFSNPAQALRACGEKGCDILLADHRMPEISGFELLLEAKKLQAYICGIMLTAYADKELLVRVINNNLVHFVLEKPLDLEVLSGTLRLASECVRDSLETEGQLIGFNGDLFNISQTIRLSAPTGENILLTGETGTGKEIIARRIHSESTRNAGPFVKINCAAIPEHLLESELFGYVKGAFTGANTPRTGRIETADKGTLFLDEIAEMRQDLQSKLLTVLQDKQVEPLGSNIRRPVDFRLITATNKDLAALVRERLFREDLYYRLNTVHIHLPPLRERRRDLALLCGHLLRKFSRDFGRPDLKIDEEAEGILRDYPWPGNIRELENALKRAVILLPPEKTALTRESLSFLAAPKNMHQSPPEHIISTLADLVEKRKISLTDIEERVMAELFRRFEGNIPKIVKKTGIPRDRLYRRKDRFI